MTITPEQKQAIERSEAGPVRLTDPDTDDTYYLLKEEIYERVCGVFFPVAEMRVPEGIIRSRTAFLRDLADLMRRRNRKVRWAAYHNDERIGLGADETELYQLCTRKGLKEEEFYVGRIAPYPSEMEEIEGGGHEVGEFTPSA